MRRIWWGGDEELCYVSDRHDDDGDVDDLYIIGAVCDVFAYFIFSLF